MVSALPDAAARAHRELPASLVTPGRWDARPPQFEADLLARLAGAAAERAILGDADAVTEAADERVVLDAMLVRGRRGEIAATALDELRSVAVAFVAEVAPVIDAAADELTARALRVAVRRRQVTARAPHGLDRPGRRSAYDRAIPLERRLDPTTPASSDTTAAPTPGPRITTWLFFGALGLACLLFFGLLVLFALTGLGVFGVVPALVVAMSLTARITKIRRMGVLILLGILSFLIVVVGSYALAVAYLLANAKAT